VRLGLEDLMAIEVTSVSKRPERLSDAAASIFVITAEEIRRSGATSIPEVLRLAPNLQVAQVNGPGYAISARGFNNSAANKLLVLIDGRSVYTPLFSGVFWDVQDVMLDDVERIEVISGPGGTLWGVNAVNGVINIITRPAKSTQGGLAAARGGNRGGEAAVRYGAALADDAHVRGYAKYLTRNHTSTEAGIAKNDAWHKVQAGLRADWSRPSGDLTLLGNAYQGREGQPLPGSIAITGVNLPLDVISLSGVNLLAHWRRGFADGSSVMLQAYYDRTKRVVPPTFAETLDLADVQFQHSLRALGRHALTWGAEYRRGNDRLVNSIYFAFLPAKVRQTWASVFAQDEIALRKDLRLTAGARVERNDYTGAEVLPNLRLAWKPAPAHLLWTAASRAVRAPSRLDRDAFVPGSAPFLLTGGPHVRSEVATVYEIGYRGQPWASTSYSATLFHAAYDHLRTQEIAPSGMSLFFGNGMKGTTHGIETWVTHQASRAWRLSAGLTAISEELRLRPGSNDVIGPAAQEGRDPAWHWRLRSSLDLPRQVELDVTARHVGALARPAVPAYAAVDVRAGWRPRREWDVSLTGQNLLGNGHAEFSGAATRTDVRRALFLEVVNHF
jgi:iron complex outermembrane receptor protein